MWLCILGLKALSGMGRREEFSVRDVCRKDVAFPKKGKGTLGQVVKILLALEMIGSCLVIYSFLNTFIEHLLYAKLLSRSWDTSVNQAGKVHSSGEQTINMQTHK